MNAPEQKRPTLFPLGLILVTPGVQALLGHDEIVTALGRHAAGDWGEADGHDRCQNERALRAGLRLFSVYRARDGSPFWVFTEADRSATTVLTPEEY